MFKSLLIAIIILYPFFGKSQTYNFVINDNEIENFLTAKLQDTSNVSHIPPNYSKLILAWSDDYLDYSIISKKMGVNIYEQNNSFIDTLITLEDKIYIKQQADSIKVKFWQTKQISFSKGINKKKKISYLSIPLFTKNHQFAIFRQQYWYDKKSGYMNILVYKKTINGWIYYGYIFGVTYS